MGSGNFSDEFKRDAVAQITERDYPVVEVSQRLGVGDRHHLHPDPGGLCLSGRGDLDLFSRRIIGRSLQNRQTTDVLLQALLMAVRRRKPKSRVWSIPIMARSSPAWTGRRS